MTTITIAYGDGVGPEIIEDALLVMREAGAQFEVESIQIGQRIYTMGSDTGILPSAWESLRRTRVLLKGPTITPENHTIKTVSRALCEKFNLPPESQILHFESLYEISATAYIGEEFALFEPVQECMPELAGKNKAHPAAAILASVMLLKHIGQDEPAERIHAALLHTLQKSKKKIRTRKFTEAVIASLFLPEKKRKLLAIAKS